MDDTTEEYLARIRKTIEESNRLVDAATLRMAETDRMLERQGLTREQVMNFRFTEAQREAANAELRRRGLEPLDMDDGWDDLRRGPSDAEADGAARDAFGPSHASSLSSQPPSGDIAERQRKFGMMMKPFQI